MINNFKKSYEQKIRLTIKRKLISSAESNENCMLHKNSDNVEIMICKDSDEIIQELFDFYVDRYQEVLEQSTEGRSFVFAHFNGLNHNSKKISLT